MNVKDIIQKGEDVKYRVVIEHDGFDMSRDAFTAELQWGLRGESLVIEKSAMREMADGGYLLGCNTAEMCGQVYCRVSYDVPDSDLEDGYRTEVENVPIFYVVDGHRMPRVCKVGAYDGTHVTLARVLKSGQSLPYAILADNSGAKLVTSDGYYLAVKTTKSDIMETYQLKQSGAEVQAILDANFLQSVTYAELVALRQSDGLVPGCKYRITDYECTTITPGTQSAGHQFDIVVQAIDVDTLSEDAEAMLHDGDTYFELCDLRRWELKYTVFNDVSRYAWADSENGKGVIYFMRDEFGNECGYDFKNIQFKRWNVTDSVEGRDISGYMGVLDNLAEGLTIPDKEDWRWAYTFDNNGEDASLKVVGYAVALDNIIGETKDWKGMRSLAGNVFYGHAHKNVLGYDCTHNTFNEADENTLGNDCNANAIMTMSRNTIGNNFLGNSGALLQDNTMGNSVRLNKWKTVTETNIGNFVAYNAWESVWDSTIGNGIKSTVIESAVGYAQILDGVSGTSASPITIPFVAGTDSQCAGMIGGAVKVWKPADLVS